MKTELDRELETAQAALLARFAPDARVRRIPWAGGETQLIELGTGPPLLYVHGGLSGAFEIVPILRALAQSRRVLAVDRPGHGLADPFDYRSVDLFDHGRTFLRDVLDALDLSTSDVVANSMGAFMSVALAIEAPERVSRLVLAGAPFGLRRRVPTSLLLLGLPLVGQRLGRHLLSNATRDGSRKFWGQVLVAHPERLDDLLLDVDVAHSRRNVESMLSLVASVADARRLGVRSEVLLGTRWQALTTPTLLVWGERDVFASVAEAEALVATNPNLRLVRIAGAGHLPWLDAPDGVVAEIERFLAAPAAGPQRYATSQSRAASAASSSRERSL